MTDTDDPAIRRHQPAWLPSTLGYLTTLGLAVVAIVPIVGNVVRVQDVDPVFMRNVVERTAELGGTYYENAIHNRGPFEPLLYDLAGRLAPYDAYWFVISAMVAVCAALLACATAQTARFFGANRSVALGAAVATYVFFTMADVGYAGVLFLRNITTAFLAVVWVLALAERPWATPRRARLTSIAVGALLGFMAQQLLTTAFSGAVVGLVALLLLHERRPTELARHVRAAVIAAEVAFAVTPLWYLARGAFGEYWSGWWTYARFMSDGPGRSFGSQVGLGWDRFYEFHARNPLVVLAIGGFAALTWVLWRELDRRRRIVHVGLLAWWLAGWWEMVLSQRYSTHYYIVVAVPTACMGAALAGHLARAVAARRPATPLSLFVPGVVAVLAVFLTDAPRFGESVTETREFRGVGRWANEHEDQLGGSERSIRAVLDLVSQDQDALLAWSTDPFIYMKNHRIPATRFQWKSFLLGEIYLGRTSPDYVLPDTWRWFEEDIEESDPVAFAETEPFDAGTPFDRLIHREFTEVYPGTTITLWLRDDVARDLVDRRADRPWRSSAPSAVGGGWTVDGTTARFQQPADGSGPGRELVVGEGPCFRLEGVADVDAPGTLANLLVRFTDPDDPTAEPQLLALEGTDAGSGSQGLGPRGFESLSVPVGDGPVRIAVVVGTRSAGLLVDGALRGAVRLPRGHTRVALETTNPQLTITDLRLGDGPAGGGCPAG
ncbi:MAG TPA: hypothetical protein VJ804_04800 [Acidimicrobiales bacterium]|nr:hypothetical protein [Acidimicrobiales bacterium]